ncbi:hypothetical protein LCGC14_0395070 [marine sediment metagenome]|uniref:Portal protein n=1 Tax=marine sediment metagenome TaxID=412755 RepID=A0A0F9TGB9_9ZZZZ
MARRSIEPNNMGVSFKEFDRLKKEYKYPDDLNLHPDSEQHAKILQLLMTAAKESYDVISARFKNWRELDEKLSVYIELDDSEKNIKESDHRRPVSIVVPIAYATRETLLTYWSAAFLQSPILRYEASRDPNDLIKVLLLENIIEQNNIRSKLSLDLHTVWSDAFTYGFGAGAPAWRTTYRYRTKYKKVVDTILGFPYRSRDVLTKEEIVDFNGNVLDAFDPYNCLPDPTVPIVKVDDMNFFGDVDRMTFNALLLEEKYGEGDYFNVKYLEVMKNKTSRYNSADESNTGRYMKQNINPMHRAGGQASQPTDIMTMRIWLIPKEYGLGDSEYPEVWMFKVASDRVIVYAQQSPYDHNKLGVVTMSPDSDGHTTLPVSILEREYPLQHGIDWLWQSHVANVRKAVNNMFVVDPSRINMNDLVDTKYGMLARTRASNWGLPVKDAIFQLPVQDVTQGHINDIGFLMNIDNLVFTNTQAKGGIEKRGDRVSATEARDTRTSFLSKMEKQAKIGGIQFHYPLADQFMSNTIQFLDDEQYVKITGDYAQVLAEEYGIDANFMKLDPRTLDVSYDVVPHDGTIPSGENAQVWERMMNNAASHPEIYEGLDFVRAWKHVARLLGAKNPEQFMKNKKGIESRVTDQGSIDEAVRKGNAIPLSQVGG